MGAEGWQLQVLQDGRDITSQHGRLASPSARRQFRCETQPQPWHHGGDILSLLTWDDEALHFYDIGAKSLRHVPCGIGFILSAPWNPRLDRLLVTAPTGAVLLDSNAHRVGHLIFTTTTYEHPPIYWTSNGEWFFVLARHTRDSKTRLTCYSAENATRDGGFDVDPYDLVPYDATQLAHVPRDQYSLVLNRSTRIVGEL